MEQEESLSGVTSPEITSLHSELPAKSISPTLRPPVAPKPNFQVLNVKMNKAPSPKRLYMKEPKGNTDKTVKMDQKESLLGDESALAVSSEGQDPESLTKTVESTLPPPIAPKPNRFKMFDRQVRRSNAKERRSPSPKKHSMKESKGSKKKSRSQKGSNGMKVKTKLTEQKETLLGVTSAEVVSSKEQRPDVIGKSVDSRSPPPLAPKPNRFKSYERPVVTLEHEALGNSKIIETEPKIISVASQLEVGSADGNAESCTKSNIQGPRASSEDISTNDTTPKISATGEKVSDRIKILKESFSESISQMVHMKLSKKNTQTAPKKKKSQQFEENLAMATQMIVDLVTSGNGRDTKTAATGQTEMHSSMSDEEMKKRQRALKLQVSDSSEHEKHNDIVQIEPITSSQGETISTRAEDNESEIQHPRHENKKTPVSSPTLSGQNEEERDTFVDPYEPTPPPSPSSSIHEADSQALTTDIPVSSTKETNRTRCSSVGLYSPDSSPELRQYVVSNTKTQSCSKKGTRLRGPREVGITSQSLEGGFKPLKKSGSLDNFEVLCRSHESKEHRWLTADHAYGREDDIQHQSAGDHVEEEEAELPNQGYRVPRRVALNNFFKLGRRSIALLCLFAALCLTVMLCFIPTNSVDISPDTEDVWFT